jgi:[ribosomal protein S18]-alanine N-acetyltransferase
VNSGILDARHDQRRAVKPGITIRNLVREDAPSVARLSRSLSSSADWDAASYERLAGIGLDGWVAVIDEHIVGFIVFRCAASELEILSLATASEFRRAGIASKLLAKCFENASQRGACKAFLEVRASNRAALALYERQGFRVSGTRPQYYRNPAEDAVLMTRVLPATNQFPIGT